MIEYGFYKGNRVIVHSKVNWTDTTGIAICSLASPSNNEPNDKFSVSRFDLTLDVSSQQQIELIPKTFSVSTIVGDSIPIDDVLTEDEVNNKPEKKIKDRLDDKFKEEDKPFKLHINSMQLGDISNLADILEGVGEVTLNKLFYNKPSKGYTDYEQLLRLNSNVRFSEKAKETLKDVLLFD